MLRLGALGSRVGRFTIVVFGVNSFGGLLTVRDDNTMNRDDINE